MYFDRITDFIFRSEKPEKADMIFIPGSGYGELAQKAAQLYREGYANRRIFSDARLRYSAKSPKRGNTAVKV